MPALDNIFPVLSWAFVGIGAWGAVFSFALAARRRHKSYTRSFRINRHGRVYEFKGKDEGRTVKIPADHIPPDILDRIKSESMTGQSATKEMAEEIDKVRAAVPYHYSCDLAQVSSAAMLPPSKTRRALRVLESKGEVKLLQGRDGSDRFILPQGGESAS